MGIQWSEEDFTHRRHVLRSLGDILNAYLDNILIKLSSYWWFETPKRLCDVSVVVDTSPGKMDLISQYLST